GCEARRDRASVATAARRRWLGLRTDKEERRADSPRRARLQPPPHGGLEALCTARADAAVQHNPRHIRHDLGNLDAVVTLQSTPGNIARAMLARCSSFLRSLDATAAMVWIISSYPRCYP